MATVFDLDIANVEKLLSGFDQAIGRFEAADAAGVKLTATMGGLEGAADKAGAAAAKASKAAEREALKAAREAERLLNKWEKAAEKAQKEIEKQAKKASRAVTIELDRVANEQFKAAEKAREAAEKAAKANGSWGERFAEAARSVSNNQLISTLETVFALGIQVGGTISRVSSVITSLIRPVAVVNAAFGGLSLAVVGGTVALGAAALAIPKLGSTLIAFGQDAVKVRKDIEGLVPPEVSQRLLVLENNLAALDKQGKTIKGTFAAEASPAITFATDVMLAAKGAAFELAEGLRSVSKAANDSGLDKVRDILAFPAVKVGGMFQAVGERIRRDLNGSLAGYLDGWKELDATKPAEKHESELERVNRWLKENEQDTKAWRQEQEKLEDILRSTYDDLLTEEGRLHEVFNAKLRQIDALKVAEADKEQLIDDVQKQRARAEKKLYSDREEQIGEFISGAMQDLLTAESKLQMEAAARIRAIEAVGAAEESTALAIEAVHLRLERDLNALAEERWRKRQDLWAREKEEAERVSKEIAEITRQREEQSNQELLAAKKEMISQLLDAWTGFFGDWAELNLESAEEDLDQTKKRLDRKRNALRREWDQVREVTEGMRTDRKRAYLEETKGERERLQEQIRNLQERKEAEKKAVRKAFALSQAAAVGEVLVSGATAFAGLLASLSPLGFGAPIAATAIVTPAVAASLAQITAQKPPAHSGAVVGADEFYVGGRLVRDGERGVIFNQRAVENGALQRAMAENEGRQDGATQAPTQLVLADGGRVIGEAWLRERRRPGSALARAFGSSPRGFTNPYRRGRR